MEFSPTDETTQQNEDHPPDEDPAQTVMFAALDSIFDAYAGDASMIVDLGNWREYFRVTKDDIDSDLALNVVVQFLRLFFKNEPIAFAKVTKVLADSSRYAPWRLPLGDSGILDFYLGLPSQQSPEPEWFSDALRLVGNSCANIDKNRERVLAKIDISKLISRLGIDEQTNLAIGVLCNLCFDYEPAQQAARNHQLFPALINMLGHKIYNMDLLSQVCRLLDFATEDFSPDLCADDAVSIICNTAATGPLDSDDEISLGYTLIALLKYERFQRLVILQDAVVSILAFLVFTYNHDHTTLIDPWQIVTEPITQQPIESTGEEYLNELRIALSAALWDVSSLSDFSVSYEPIPKLLQIMVLWLREPIPQLQVCACSILRNIACTDETSIQLVNDVRAHVPLVEILQDLSDWRVLEEALRLLKNLAIPTLNKPIIGTSYNLDLISTIWSKLDNPSVLYASVSLIRHLLKGCFPCVACVLDHHVEISDSQNLSNSKIRRLLSLYRKASDLTLKMEIARTVVEIYRTLYAHRPNSALTDLEYSGHYADHVNAEMAEPIVKMITESENPSLVTEGWFGLTLMASSSVGADAAIDALSGDQASAAFKAALMAEIPESKDRDNARILASRLMDSNANNPARHAFLKSILGDSVGQ